MKPLKGLQVRRWRDEDIPGIVACHAAAYDDYPPNTHYGERECKLQMQAFPEGQAVAIYRNQVVGYATSILVTLEEDLPLYTFGEITGSATFSTHDPAGDSLYGADIAVHPDFRGRGVAGKLYEFRHKLLKRYNLRRMIAYGRIPGYVRYAGSMTAEEYVAKVLAGELKDPALSAHLKAGYQVKRVVLNLFRDTSSLHYSTLLEKLNPDFRPERRRLAAAPLKRPVRKIRVCAAQYKLDPIDAWEQFASAVEFFVDTADTYHCHYLLFPELLVAQLLNTLPKEWSPVRAFRAIAGMHERYLDMFKSYASQHQLYIVGGSFPVVRDDGRMYNVAHLFSPTGQVYTQDKLHLTPSERHDFGMSPGHGVKVFDTAHARIAIQVCYDVEFPEIARLLTLAGVELIFVPFSTDERKAYLRVRYCAQARAVENYIFLALAGNVGNMPNRSYLLNYGQAAIVTPSDFGFPPDAIAAQSEPNFETVSIADLDLVALAQQRESGSVRPLHDRRVDLYSVRAETALEFVQAE